MKIAVLITRILLGLIYVIFGFNFFLHFIPLPAMPGPGGDFEGALFKAGYLFPFMKVIEIATGVALLINKYTAFFVVLIFPVTVNIFLFHAFLSLEGLPIGLLMLLINLFLGYAYRKYYSSVFTLTPVVD